MNDLELPEDPTPTQSYIPVNSLSPTRSAGPTSPKPKIRLTSESAFLLQTYVRTVATWMDIFDHASTYQHKVPQLALGSPLLFHCVCAFTANHLALSNSSHDPSWGVCAVRHYGEALRLLIEALSMPEHEHALTASMLLLSYEIHGALRSEDYRRHYLGLVSLVKSRRVTAQSTGIDLANFWIYVRHEIVVAMASEQPLVFNPAEWEVSWVEGETREDVLGNHVLWILARVINLVFGPDGNTEVGKIQRQDFLHEMEIWRRGLSETFSGIPHGEKDEDGFCKVYFPVAAAAAAAFCMFELATNSGLRNTDLVRVPYCAHTTLCRASTAGRGLHSTDPGTGHQSHRHSHIRISTIIDGFFYPWLVLRYVYDYCDQYRRPILVLEINEMVVQRRNISRVFHGRRGSGMFSTKSKHRLVMIQERR